MTIISQVSSNVFVFINDMKIIRFFVFQYKVLTFNTALLKLTLSRYVTFNLSVKAQPLGESMYITIMQLLVQVAVYIVINALIKLLKNKQFNTITQEQE